MSVELKNSDVTNRILESIEELYKSGATDSQVQVFIQMMSAMKYYTQNDDKPSVLDMLVDGIDAPVDNKEYEWNILQ